MIKTSNSRLWASGRFEAQFVGLDVSAAQWCVAHGVKLVGVDYLSVQSPRESGNVHRALLGAGVIVLEGLDLSRVYEGQYDLCVLPLKLEGTEAAPARAVVRRRESSTR